MDHKREHRPPPVARVMGVGRQQQQQQHGNAGVGDVGGVVEMSAGHAYLGCTRDSDSVFNGTDVLGVNVGRGIK